MTDSLQLVEQIVRAAKDKKAKDVVILSLQEISPIADYFVIMTGGSKRQVQAITDNIEDELKGKGILPFRKEGFQEGKWVLVDFGSVVTHVFQEEERDFYSLERLWGDAEVIEM